jgi:chromosome segregation ATPase
MLVCNGISQTSQSTLLLKKKKEMREVDESLELMKRDHKRRMDICEQRRIRFEEKQAKMREQVLKFEKFIQENDAKRIRAELKAKQERKLYEEKVREIAALNEEIKKLEQDQQQLDSELKRKNDYRQFLENIVENGDYGYEEIKDVLTRYYTLKEANEDLQITSTKLEENVDRVTRDLQEMRIKKQNDVLVSTSIVQGLQVELEKRRLQGKLQEEDNVLRIDKKKGVSTEFTQIIQAIRNLYARCYATMKVKSTLISGAKESTGLFDTLDNNLEVIQSRIKDLMEIVNEYKADGITTLASAGSSSNNLQTQSVMSLNTRSVMQSVTR